MRWRIDPSHRAAVMEFAIPMLAAVAYLATASAQVGMQATGILVLLSTASAFVANLEVMGGRAIVGRVMQVAQPGPRASLIGTGLLVSTIGATLMALVLAWASQQWLEDAGLMTQPSWWLLLPFAAGSAMSHIANYLGWCRLGAGDEVGRSRVVITSNLVSLLVTLGLFVTDQREPAAYAAPFFCRDLVSLLLALRWSRGAGHRFTLAGWPQVRAYRRVAVTGFVMALIVGLFEPLLKMFLAVVLSPAVVPAFEILIRLLAAIRNGITILLQTFATSIVGDSPTASQRIQGLDRLALSLAICALLIGLLVIHWLADVVVRGSAEVILPLYLMLIPSFAFYAATLPRYLALYLNGRIGGLLLVHAGLALAPALMTLFHREASLEGVALVFSVSYFIGAAITYQLGVRRQGPFAGVPWGVAVMLIAVPILCAAAFRFGSGSAPSALALAALLCAVMAGAVTLKIYSGSTRALRT